MSNPTKKLVIPAVIRGLSIRRQHNTKGNTDHSGEIDSGVIYGILVSIIYGLYLYHIKVDHYAFTVYKNLHHQFDQQ